MQSKDLRIGNLVKHLDYHLEVQKIGFTKIWTQDDTKSFDEIEPIPLTEKWLTDFGFPKNHLHIFKRNGILVTEDFEMCLGQVSVELKFVHQFQNLYFALTGEELELKSESKP